MTSRQRIKRAAGEGLHKLFGLIEMRDYRGLRVLAYCTGRSMADLVRGAIKALLFREGIDTATLS